LADDRTRVGDFATTAGGGVFAVSVDGAITGRGASFIIFDDPVAIADSANSQKLEQVNERFDGEIMSRLNEPRAGRVLITQHRLHPNDLTGHVLETGGWDHIGLPFIAPKDQEYDLDGRLWYRKKGELLRPDAFTAADIDRIRAIINPDFEALYQQYMGESSSVRICRGSFGTFILAPPDAPVIISVDPGHRSGPGHSFTVMQALCWAGEEVFLLDQWRAQSDVDTACRALRIGTANCRPAAVLIECSGYGPVLARSLQKRSRSVDVRLIATEHRSKVKRLLGHVDQIQRGNVKLPHDVRWREAFETEMELFPHGPFDDQVDALTQGLDYIRQSPPLKKIQPPCPGVYINHRGVATFANTMSSFGNQISYTGLGRSGRRRRIFPEQD
jgi:predicted phage terminase large subunit-like protein